MVWDMATERCAAFWGYVNGDGVVDGGVSRVSRNSGGCYSQRTLSKPVSTGPAFEGDEGAVTRTQSSRSRRWNTAEEMYDEQL